MADYEPTLDDGELWLPSEIMADVGIRPHFPYHHRSSSVPSAVHQHRVPTEVEELASNLAAFGLLGQAQLLPGASGPPPAALRRGFQLDGPSARIGPVAEREAEWARLVYRELLRSAAPAAASGGGRGLGGNWRLGLTGRFGPTQPVQWRMEAVGRFQQRPPRPGQSRGGGTGVFLPRVVGNNQAAAAKKQRDSRGREQHRQASKNPAALRQGTPFQPPPASGLPADWTY